MENIESSTAGMAVGTTNTNIPNANREFVPRYITDSQSRDAHTNFTTEQQSATPLSERGICQYSRLYKYFVNENLKSLVNSTKLILDSDNSDETKKSLLTIKRNGNEIIPINDLFKIFPVGVLEFIKIIDTHCNSTLKQAIYRINNLENTARFSLLDDVNKIEILTKYILEQPSITSREKVKLLTTEYKSSLDISEKLKANNYKVIEIFLDLILNSKNIEETYKLKILLAKNQQKETLVDNVLSSSKIKVMDKIITMIANSSLSDEGKIIVIQSKTYGSANWFYKDLSKTNNKKTEEIICNYIYAIVHNESLDDNFKKRLLIPEDENSESISLNNFPIINQILDIFSSYFTNSLFPEYQRINITQSELGKLQAKKIAEIKASGRNVVIISENAIGYHSKGMLINRNGKITGHENQDSCIGGVKIKVTTFIVCRHIVNAWIYAQNHKDFFQIMQNPEQIAELPAIQEDDFLKRDAKISKEVYIFHYQDFGKLIHSLVTPNWGKVNYKKTFFYSTGCHLMAIGIKNKDEGRSCKIFIFDPNCSIYKIRIYTPEAATQLKFKDFCGDYLVKDKDDKDCWHAIHSIETTIDNYETHVIGNITSLGAFTNIIECEHVNSINPEDTSTVIKLITPEDMEFIIKLAFSRRKVISIKYLVNSILNADLDITKKFALLMKNANTGYINTFINNDVVLFEAFFKVILFSDKLLEREKISLLSGEQNENGLYNAFKYNNREIIESYIKLVLESNLSLEGKKTLLKFRSYKFSNSNYNTFLFISGESVKIFFDILHMHATELESEIRRAHYLINRGQENLYPTIITRSIHEIEKQIDISYPYHRPSLSCLIEDLLSHKINLQDNYGCGDIVKFLTEFLDNNNIDEKDKQKILLRETNNFFVSETLLKNTQNHELILKFFRVVLISKNITDIQKVKLLLRYEQHKPLVDKILAKTNIEFIDDIIALITQQQTQSSKVLHRNLQEIYISANDLSQKNKSLLEITTLIEIILTSDLPNAMKVEALTIRGNNQEIIPINSFFVNFSEGLVTLTNVIHKYSNFVIEYKICKFNNLEPIINLTISYDLNKIEVLTKYILQQEDLTSLKKIELLTSDYKARSHVPEELQKYDYKIVKRFILVVLNSDHIKEEDKLQILLTKNRQGKSLIDDILLNGTLEIINEFASIVENSSLSTNNIEKILYDRLNMVPKKACFFHKRDIGLALQHLVANYHRQENYNEIFFYSTTSHIIPIKITAKKNVNTVSIYVYPHNQIRQHIITVDNFQSIKKLGIDEILGLTNQDVYQAISDQDIVALCSLRTSAETIINTKVIGSITAETAISIVRYGQIKSRSQNQMDEMFTKFSIDTIKKMLLIAFEKKHIVAIEYIVKSILQSQTISKANKIAFLTNSRGTANYGYVQAQVNADIEISTAFHSVISSSEELTDQEKRRILDTPREYTLYQ